MRSCRALVPPHLYWLQGKSPFKGPNMAAIVKAACKGVYDPLPDYISSDCKDLLAGLLTVNPVSVGPRPACSVVFVLLQRACQQLLCGAHLPICASLGWTLSCTPR